MHAWQIPYLGWHKLPADLSGFEIEHFFTLRPEERRAVRSRYKPILRLGAALQVGYLRMCGRPLGAVQRVRRHCRSTWASIWPLRRLTSPRCEGCITGAAELSTSTKRGRSGSSA